MCRPDFDSDNFGEVVVIMTGEEIPHTTMGLRYGAGNIGHASVCFGPFAEPALAVDNIHLGIFGVGVKVAFAVIE